MRAHQMSPLLLPANRHHRALIYSYMILNPPNCRLVNTLSLQNSFIKTHLKASPLGACDTDALTPHSTVLARCSRSESRWKEKKRRDGEKKSWGNKAEVCGNKDAAGCFSQMNYGGWIAVHKLTQLVQSFLFSILWFNFMACPNLSNCLVLYFY